MNESPKVSSVSLESSNPYELRVDLGRHVPESEVRAALATGEMGFLHSFTTGSTLDGPGVRVVAWVTGCQFRCLYCHNPDTWNLMNGIPVTLERAKAQLGRYRHGLRVMKGGFTISGGEPLMQHRFVVNLFEAAQSMGIHTALDTNGSLGNRLTDGDLEKINLVMLDIKAWGEERHRQLAGMDLAPVLEFARRLAARQRPVWLRYVLVPGWNDTLEEVAPLARFAADLGNVERVDVLPLHQMGAFKWKQLQLEYKLQDLDPPTKESIERTCAQFQRVGLKAY